MKYGESIFDILYLLFAISAGTVILRKSKDQTSRMMGLAALILGCGDAFHLVPRVLNYFLDADMTAALGIGKLVTSMTMTVFYVLLAEIWTGVYTVPLSGKMRGLILGLSALRIILCLLPQNGWLENSSDMTWGIIRNVPFVILGGIVCRLYYQKKSENRTMRWMWLYILLSFLFYIPVAAAAGLVPMLGMLMLPKTVCYILMIVRFLRYVGAGSD